VTGIVVAVNRLRRSRLSALSSPLRRASNGCRTSLLAEKPRAGVTSFCCSPCLTAWVVRSFNQTPQSRREPRRMKWLGAQNVNGSSGCLKTPGRASSNPTAIRQRGSFNQDGMGQNSCCTIHGLPEQPRLFPPVSRRRTCDQQSAGSLPHSPILSNTRHLISISGVCLSAESVVQKSSTTARAFVRDGQPK